LLPLLVWQSLPTITLIYGTVLVGEEHQQWRKRNPKIDIASKHNDERLKRLSIVAFVGMAKPTNNYYNLQWWIYC
jgi:hypothetical protein